MRKHLVLTMLRAHYGKGAPQPLRAAFARLVLSFGMAAGSGVSLQGAMARLGGLVLLPLVFQCAVVALIAMLGGGVVLLAQYSSTGEQRPGDTLGAILHMLPLTRKWRWFMRVSPGLVVVAILSVFSSLLIASLPGSEQGQKSILLMVTILSLLSAQGLLLLERPHHVLGKTGIFIGIVAASVLLLDKSLRTGFNVSLAATSLCVVLVPIAGHLMAVRQVAPKLMSTMQVGPLRLLPSGAVVRFWTLVKLFRNSRSRNAFAVVMALSSALAGMVLLRRGVAVDAYGMLMVSACLAATFTAEIRGLVARYQPPEYVLTGGLIRSIFTQSNAAILCALTIGLPLGAVLLSRVPFAVEFTLYFVALHTAAATIGQLCGALFVPGAGDTANQFFAGILSMLLLIVLPRMAHFGEQAYVVQAVCWLLIAVSMVCVIQIIEEIRRKRYGHA